MSLPKHVISQLQEHSSLGFMLFYTDESGSPAHHFSFDCDTAYHGLASYAEMILTSLKSLDREKFREFILSQMDDDE